MRIVDAPCPQPTSATRAPRSSFACDAVERRDPGLDQVRDVAGPEEPLGAVEEAGSCSCQPKPAPERNASVIWGCALQRAGGELERAGHERGAVLVASANACSSVMLNRSRVASYST